MPQEYNDLSKDQLVELLKRRDRERKLGLVWERREIAPDKSVNSDFLLLEDEPALSVGGDERANMIIEGDNFDALRWLRTTKRGAIKFIYIDPPYNSGKKPNDTFVYNDDYVDPQDDYRHSKWLEFMYQRLWLARDLLAPDGLLFVSIDDEEMARLRLLMEIVLPGNFQACLIWQSDGNSDNTAAFKIQHEYILVYSRDKRAMLPPPVIDPNIDEETSKLFNDQKRNTFVKNGPKNPPSTLTMPAGFPATFESGEIAPRDGTKWPHHDQPIIVKDFQVATDVDVYSGWQGRNLFLRFVAQGFAPVIDDKGQLTSFVLDANGAIQSFKPRGDDQSHVLSVIRNVGSVQKTKSDLQKIGIAFDYPKPPGLIKYLLQMIPGKDFIALDFFAGTGTTGEAVARLNIEDGGTRRWIMASSTEATPQKPDTNVCRDACARRLRHFYETDGKPIESATPSLFGFTYSRLRRTTLGDVDQELSPALVWTWIQVMHSVAPKAYDPSSTLQVAQAEDGQIIYVDRASSSALDVLSGLLNGKPSFIYSWTPGRFTELLEGKVAEVRRVPEFFAERLAR